MWYSFDNGDLILSLRIQPKASSNELAEIMENERKLRITAPPVDGKANKHIIALLAKMCKVAKGDVTIESGELGRNKRVRIKSPRLLPDGVNPPASA
ncbi:MAG: YggU family protein [Campylobacterales bacterium]|nr:YggU family protein [Campylobacterales bacterium]